MSTLPSTSVPVAGAFWRDERVVLRLLYGFQFFLGLAWVVLVWVNATGTPADDELTHVLVARAAWNYPELILDIWTRVANTVIFMVPSLLGLNGVRFISLALSVLTVLLATGVARQLGVRWLFLVPLALWFQPWFGMLSYTGIKSVPFMFFLTLGWYWWLAGRPSLAALAVGIVPLSRHEGIALLGLWFLYMLWERKWWAAAACWVPIVIYNVVYLVGLQADVAALPIAIYFRPQGSGLYGSGPIWYFIPGVVGGVGPVVVLWALRGLAPLIRTAERRKLAFFGLHIAYFAAHSLIYYLGLYDTGGYVMFLLPLAPAFAVVAVLGIERAWRNLQGRSRPLSPDRGSSANVRFSVLAIAPVILSGVVIGQPFQMNEVERLSFEAVAWVREYGIAAEDVYSTYPWFNLNFEPAIFTPVKKQILWSTVETLRPGQIFIWDVKYSESLGISLSRLDSAPDQWRRLVEFRDSGGDAIVIFERTGPS